MQMVEGKNGKNACEIREKREKVGGEKDYVVIY